jgi:hypothetical protein
MGEVFAGFLAGYILALLSTPVLAFALVRLRATSAVLSRLLPPGVSAIGLGVLVHGALFMFWTALGILLGLVLLAMGDAGEALGSRNGAFTLFVAALVLMFAAPIVLAVRPLRQPALACAVAAVLVFGWLMPYMAEWSKFDRGGEPRRLESVPFTATVRLPNRDELPSESTGCA